MNILENDFDLRLRFQLGFLHWFHFLLYWPPPLMLELVVLQKLGNSILGRGSSLVPSKNPVMLDDPETLPFISP